MSSKSARRAESARKAEMARLRATVAELRRERDRQLPFGWAELVRWIPEMDRLHRALLEAIWLADPRRARSLDVVGGSSGEGPAIPGADTSLARHRVSMARRAVAGAAADVSYEVAMAFTPELVPESEQRAKGDTRPRCGRADCKSRRRRQAPGQPYCGWCGADLETLR